MSPAPQQQISRVPIDSIEPDERNARKHTEANLAAIRVSLERFGQAEPLVVQRDTGRLIGGHGRYAVMRQLGWTECDVVELEIEDAEADALNLALNRTAELAEWDYTKLSEALGEIRERDEAAVVGFATGDFKRIGRLATREERDRRRREGLEDPGPDEPPEPPVTQPGDTWLLGRNRITCGDCTDEAMVAQACGQLVPEIMVTDPPYGVDYDPAWREAAGMQPARLGAVTNDDRAAWLEAWQRFPGSVAYVWHASTQTRVVAADLERSGLEVRSLIVWGKDRAAIGRGAYHWQHELCYYAVRRMSDANWAGARDQSTLWLIPRNDGGEQTDHSTQKPMECMERPMRNHNWSVAYDPFCGSGTSLIAAERTGLSLVALELEPSYVDIAVERWQRATGLEATLESTGETYFATQSAQRAARAQGAS